MSNDEWFDDDNESMDETVVSTGYEPRPLQAQIHALLPRFGVLAIHRRFGKTVMGINHGIHVGLQVTLPNPRVSFISPLYKQSKTVAWDYLKTFTRNIPGVKSYESELRVDIPMGNDNIFRFQLFGADNPDSLRGMYHDYVIFDEYGNQSANIWTDVVSPALADRHGGALFLGTPAGKNHFYTMYQTAKKKYEGGDNEWFAATYRADETGVISDAELEQQRDNLDECSYRTEFLCDFAAALRGAFYADHLIKAKDQGRICRVPYETALPVFAAFDLGIDDMTAVWFIQCHRNEIRVIDYCEWVNSEGLGDVLKDMQNMEYIYAQMLMPWDISIREQTTGKSRLEYVENLGFEVETAQKLSIEDGINAVRVLLSQCWFDEKKCADGIDRLENYRKKYDPRRGEFLKTPEHDLSSHGADAFRTLAVIYHPGMGEMFMSGSNTMNRQQRSVTRSI